MRSFSRRRVHAWLANRNAGSSRFVVWVAYGRAPDGGQGRTGSKRSWAEQGREGRKRLEKGKFWLRKGVEYF